MYTIKMERFSDIIRNTFLCTCTKCFSSKKCTCIMVAMIFGCMFYVFLAPSRNAQLYKANQHKDFHQVGLCPEHVRQNGDVTMETKLQNENINKSDSGQLHKLISRTESLVKDRRKKRGPKPEIVMGILSSGEFSTRREVVRKTWLTLIEHAPFHIKYKFLIDSPTKLSESENRIYGDIIYLNTSTGYAMEFADKLVSWFKHALKEYPSAKLIGRIDDDVYICTPQVFDRIYDIMSSNLYYGYQKNVKNTWVDEMFLVMGRDLVEEFATQRICGNDTEYSERACNYAEWAVREWMMRRKVKADWRSDNNKMIHFDRTYSFDDKMFKLGSAKLNFCENNLLFHKSSPTLMFKFDYFNRLHLKNTLRYDIKNTELMAADFPNVQVMKISNVSHSCKIWAVTVAGSISTRTYRNFLAQTDWCLVIVGDQFTPIKTEYMEKIGILHLKNVYFLSPEDQVKMFPSLSETLFWDHFGRRNIGYMFAIQQKAKLIIDMDFLSINTLEFTEFTLRTNFSSYIEMCTATPNTETMAMSEKLALRAWTVVLSKNDMVNRYFCLSRENVQIGAMSFVPVNKSFLKMLNKASLQESEIPFVSLRDTEISIYPTVWYPSTFKFLALPISKNQRTGFFVRNFVLSKFMRKKNLRHLVKPMSETDMELSSGFENLDVKTNMEMSQLFENNKDNFEVDKMFMELFESGIIGYEDISFSRAWTRTFEKIHDL